MHDFTREGNVMLDLSSSSSARSTDGTSAVFHGSRRLRGRSQLSTFMKAYTAYARGEGVWDHRTLFPENQHLILITDNVL